MKDRQGRSLRTVWVLGAGFSRSLGGPLLPDLFRQEDLSDLQARYPSVGYNDLAEACWRTQGLFNWGKFVERQWGDAEQFLDFVDSARSRSPEEALLLRMNRAARIPHETRGISASFASLGSRDLESTKSEAVRALAAECSWFWRFANDQTERWAPYRMWLDSLEEFDTVVSFNYDGVIEKLANNNKHAVVLPNHGHNRGDKSVRILKLHGSVMWLREGTGCRTADPAEVLVAPGGFLALGTPGQTKRAMKDDLFEPLWRAAEVAIREAEVVVCLGYRFPETDGDARRRILGAITTNDSQRLRIRVVLGPNTSLPDVVRVQRLLSVCASQNRVEFRDQGPVDESATSSLLNLAVEPLLVEDYLTLFANDGPLSRVL